ncbi:hypothetical protein M758_UG007100 [Ceratodon purpureus]|nr:hypothetical protein M758_UG007100 [Ceratodon purpureus]
MASIRVLQGLQGLTSQLGSNHFMCFLSNSVSTSVSRSQDYLLNDENGITGHRFQRNHLPYLIERLKYFDKVGLAVTPTVQYKRNRSATSVVVKVISSVK